RVKFRERLINKYRLVILNEDTFEEKLSFKLTIMNVFIFGTIFSVLLIVGTSFFISFTSLREYIPGYPSTKLKREATQLVYKVDSLTQILEANNLYIEKVKALLTGEITEVQLDKDTVLNTSKLDKDSMK